MTDLMEVRTALTSTTNNNMWAGTTGGGAEINKIIDSMIVDNINRDVDLRPLISRKPLNTLTYTWNLRTDIGSTSKFSVYSEGGYGTPYPSSKRQMYATAISYRADYEVSGLMMAASASYYDALADEAKDAIDAMKINEEKMMICGSDASAYGITSGFDGLLQLMLWNTTNGGDTESDSNKKNTSLVASVMGHARATSATSDLDVSYVWAGTAGTATGVLELKHMDEAKDRSDKHGGKSAQRVYFSSVERGSEINRLLQPQQRFAGTLNLEGGFSVSTYHAIPIVTSRFMDKNGLTNVSSIDDDTHADNSMYLLDLDQLEMRILAGVDSVHIPIMGGIGTGNIRLDVAGGYFKTYAIFACKKFNTHCHICNLTAP